MNFAGENILYTEQFDRSSLEKVLQVAKDFLPIAINKEKTDLLSGDIMASLFYEPSTRTKFSFETAMLRLGGEVISVSGKEVASLAKGETLEDTAKVIDQFADVIVVRHPEKGSAERMALSCEAPLINAGDGSNQHPTQALLDLFTMNDVFDSVDGLTVAMVGDLKYGRTVHSLVNILRNYKVNFVFVAPDELQMPDEYCADLTFEKTESIEDALSKADVLYMTRIQRERFESEDEYNKYKGSYVLDKDSILGVNQNIKIMHPLPRVDEIATDLDELPNALYFKQVQNGVAVRMALLALVLGKV